MSTDTSTTDGDVLAAIEAQMYGESAETAEPEAQQVQAEDAEEATQGEEQAEEEGAQEQEGKAADWVQALGIQEDQLVQTDDGRFLINTKIGGEIKAVPAADLIKSYQLEGHLTKRSQELAEQRKADEAKRIEMQEAVRRVEEQKQVADAIVSHLEQTYLGEYNSVNWAALEQSDPAEYVRLERDFKTKADQLIQAKEALKQEQLRVQEQETQRIQEANAQYLQHERQLMLDNNPTWADEAVMKQAVGEIRDFLGSTYGFSDQDLDAVNSHLAIKVIQDAMAYRKAKAAAAPKLEKPVPKFQKPGKPQQTQAARSAKKKYENLRKSGKTADLASILVDRM